MIEDRYAGKERTVLLSKAFKEFFDGLGSQEQNNIEYVIDLIIDHKLIHTSFVKKLIDTEFYEMRVKIGYNEYRTIVFSVDHDNIIEATKVYLLNGFLKKSTKDYKKQINRSKTILEELKL
ncbi:type II toxin-antitoxin system RelE/ParE family toxin [Parabacteroides sp. PF5-6]|uniref:type II toxin-antitoxin system RelE/ParE family toxin n=1 Tax=Parabacteroides sp. PF5-6 TaxID=1742403 RepID=UPI0024071502|nr:type II toxin-antitoxin system RelE/ParE family toxin [Parabacteroides sp. PF5-6]MDF9830474.1 hypothetical protein [Parabacteroides sp. PF5-6]